MWFDKSHHRPRMGVPISVLVVAAFWLLFWPTIVTAAPPAQASDYDLRAARALFNAVRPGALPSADQLPANLPRKLSRWEVVPSSRKRIYALKFGRRGGSGDDRGYYKITLNGQLSDATAKGWQVLTTRDEQTGAEVLLKRVRKSTADQYNSLGVRRKIGNVVLTVAQRRPLDESPSVGARELLARFASLIAQAKENRLFARVMIARSGPEGALREIDISQGGLPFALHETNEPVEIPLLLEVRDGDGNPMAGIRRYTFRVLGRYREFVDILGAQFDPEYERWTVTGRDRAEILLRIDPGQGRLRDVLYKHMSRRPAPGAASEPAIRLKVGAKLETSPG